MQMQWKLGELPHELLEMRVERVKLVVHAMDAAHPANENHWSIYLCCIANSVPVSLRLDMNFADGRGMSLFGALTISYHLDDPAYNELQSWVYPALHDDPNTEYTMVTDFLKLLKDKGRDRYRFTASGCGWRHWVYVVMEDWIVDGILEVLSSDNYMVEQVVPYIYSPIANPTSVEVQPGSFY